MLLGLLQGEERRAGFKTCLPYKVVLETYLFLSNPIVGRMLWIYSMQAGSLEGPRMWDTTLRASRGLVLNPAALGVLGTQVF